MKSYILSTLFILTLLSCSQNENSSTYKIYGKWQGSQWMVGDEKAMGFDASIINFEFKPDSIYIARMGMDSEEGTFNLRNNCFNAHSVYGINKKCPILKLTKDTMIWMMDSVHQPGNLYLVRVKE